MEYKILRRERATVVNSNIVGGRTLSARAFSSQAIRRGSQLSENPSMVGFFSSSRSSIMPISAHRWTAYARNNVGRRNP